MTGRGAQTTSPRSTGRRVVFDFGAVVFHWQPARMLMRELPLRATDAASAAHWAAQIFQGYTGDWADFDRGLVAVPELVARISARTGLRPDEAQTAIDGVARELQPQAATVALLQRLHAGGRRLHYLSNMPAPVADLLEARNPFMACFESGVFSCRVQLIKPDPAIYRVAADRFGASGHDLVFIDDHPPNVAAARALGWDGFVFTDAAQAEADLTARHLL
jgi:HAD superfamily hydrolase (TIGR01509 family)